MIEVIYDGNLGNNLFQYCIGRILANELGYKLKADPINGFQRTFDFVDGEDYSSDPAPLIYTKQFIDLEYLIKARPCKKIILNGYFQRYEYYVKYKVIIKNDWLVQDLVNNEDVSKDDLVVGIRRGKDYIPQHGLPISYYEEAISHIDYKNMFICTNDPKDPFIKYFKKKYSAVVRPPGALDNLAFIRRFNKIIISNSTFLWWGAFLSNADQIICPIPLNGFWSKHDPISEQIDLKVPEDRFIYLACKERYKSRYIGEIINNAYSEFRLKLPEVVPPRIWSVIKKLKSISVKA